MSVWGCFRTHIKLVLSSNTLFQLSSLSLLCTPKKMPSFPQNNNIMDATTMTISPKCIRPIRIALLASILILSSIPFLVVNYAQNNNVVDDAWSRLRTGPPAPHSSSSSSSSSKGGVPQGDKAVIRPTSCRDVLADATIYDPNKDIASKESTRRLTVTVPQFYISLHSESL